MNIPNILEAVSPPVQVTPVKDEPSVTADGDPLKPLIVGVKVRYQRPIEDARGEVTEVYRSSWGRQRRSAGLRLSGGGPARHDQRLGHPRAAGGSHLSHHWAPRTGRSTTHRAGSATRGLQRVRVQREESRAARHPPRRLSRRAATSASPTRSSSTCRPRPYEHGDPDKFRLPLKNSLIPFSFDDDPSR